MKYPYYPGCTLKTKAKNFETSALAVAKALDIDLVELDRWNCCGAVPTLANDDLMKHLAPVRNFLRVKEMNKKGILDNQYQLIVFCSMCYNVLKMSNLRVKKINEDLAKLNDFMYKEIEKYDKEVEVVNFLELLKKIGYDKIKEKIKFPLNELKVSPYYGCTLLRPRDISIDDPEDPTILEDLLNSLSVTVVNSPLKTRCCGSYQTVSEKEIVENLVYDIIKNAQNSGAQMIVTSCPLCAFNLDKRQIDISKKHSDFKEMPILYFTQLMAVAFGLDEECFGFELNYVKPEELIRKEKEKIERINSN